MYKRCSILFFLIPLLISGCGTATLKQAEREGRSQLTARQIYDLVAGNTLQMNAYDFQGTFYFKANGSLAGLDNMKQSDIGAWDINQENQLCLKFQIWYYGDLKCYTLTPGQKAGQYTFFTANGALYYNGVQSPGDPKGLADQLVAGKQEASRYLRKSFASSQPAETAESETDIPADSQRATHVNSVPAEGLQNNPTVTVRRLARDCPGCDLSGADLKEAGLVQANLAEANLSGADLRYANLRRANLAGANLRGAKLNHANLPGADLKGCDLSNADLSGANLLMADLTGAKLNGAILTNAYLENTKGLKK